MTAKTSVILLFGFLCALAAISAAASTTAGTFSCPSGQTEDLQCAANCCQQYGGTYSYSDQSCDVTSTAAWNQAAQCEQQSGCCTSQGISAPSSSCCGPAFLIGAVVVGSIVFSRNRK